MNCSIQTYEHCNGVLSPPPQTVQKKGFCSIWTKKSNVFFPCTIRMLNAEWRTPSLFLCIDTALEGLQLLHIISHSRRIILLFKMPFHSVVQYVLKSTYLSFYVCEPIQMRPKKKPTTELLHSKDHKLQCIPVDNVEKHESAKKKSTFTICLMFRL